MRGTSRPSQGLTELQRTTFRNVALAIAWGLILGQLFLWLAGALQ